VGWGCRLASVAVRDQVVWGSAYTALLLILNAVKWRVGMGYAQVAGAGTCCVSTSPAVGRLLTAAVSD
jgi:hypothetical protein